MIISRENYIGAWSFLIGIFLAMVIGLATSLINIPFIIKYNPQIYAILVILGIIIGFINVKGEDIQTFLIASAVLVVVSKFGMESVTGSIIGIGIGDAVTSIFGALLALLVPSTIVVALKTIFSIAKV